MGKAKSLQELTLLDRFLFSVVMEDNETLEDVLEIILGYPVPLKDKAQAEKELRRTPLNKSVFFDVYGEDFWDIAYDVEVQKEDEGPAETNTILQWNGRSQYAAAWRGLQ